MQMPCPNPVNCPGVDRPVINRTAEAPDEIKTFGYGFFSDGRSRFCEDVDPEAADICAAVDDPNNPGPISNPPVPVVYTSDAQTCTVNCGGNSQTYTAPAGTATALSQLTANQLAYEFACSIAQILCVGPIPTIYQSAAQSCTATCPDGTRQAYSVPAGLFSATSQQAANGLALTFACQLAALLCASNPPLPPGAPPTGGAGGQPPQLGAFFGNAPQTCLVTCPTGGQSSFVVRAGRFVSSSPAAANAIAASYACRQANLILACVGDVESMACVGEFYSSLLVVTNLVEPITWFVSAGTLPAGLELADDLILGLPTTSGVSAFTLSVVGYTTTGEQVTVTRSFSIKTMEISTTTLPDGDEDAAYSTALAASGNVGALIWSVSSGVLPDGLTLNPSTGVISGTPTESGDFPFVVTITDTDGHQCSKALSLTIESASVMPLNWWKFEEAAGDRIDSLAGVAMAPFGGVSQNAGLILFGMGVDPAAAFTVAGVTSSAGGLAGLRYQGNGIEVIGWVRIDSQVGTDGVIDIRYETDTDPGFPGTLVTMMRIVYSAAIGNFQLQAQTGNPPGFAIINSTGPAPAVGDWSMFRMYFDPVTGKFGLQINNGTIDESVLSYTLAACTIGRLTVAASWNNPGEEIVVTYDETGIFQPNLDAAGVDYVFNGGAGRTFP